MQSETLCVFDVVEAAWPFFSVSEIKKAKKKKNESAMFVMTSKNLHYFLKWCCKKMNCGVSTVCEK